MKIKGIAWVGVKTDRFEMMRMFCKNVLNLSEALEQSDFAVFRAGEHDKFEIFGPAGPGHPAGFASNRVVSGFEVDDIEAARQELHRAGIELIGDLVRVSLGGAWQLFRGPDGLVYELTYIPESR
ncbi:MAG: VOC family protein [Thermoplasmata archaeon]